MMRRIMMLCTSVAALLLVLYLPQIQAESTRYCVWCSEVDNCNDAWNECLNSRPEGVEPETWEEMCYFAVQDCYLYSDPAGMCCVYCDHELGDGACDDEGRQARR